MAERTTESALRELMGLMERASRTIDDRPEGTRTAVGTAAQFSIQMAVAMLARAAESLSDADSVQRAAVYGQAAEHLAPVVDAPEAAVFRALIELCGEPGDGVFASALAPADPLVVAALRRTVVRITIGYDVGDIGAVVRTLELWYDADRAGLRRKQIRQEISWDDTPEDVRGRRLELGDRSVSFQLFP